MVTILTDTQRQLVEEYYGYAVFLAYKMGRSYIRPFFDLDDIRQSALIGLIAAACKYDSSRDCSFRSYSYRRIIGEIQDAFRALSCYSRSEFKSLNAHHKQYTERTISCDADLDILEDAKYSLNFDCVGSLDSKKLQLRFATLLLRLSFKQRYVLTQHYIKDRSLWNIGQDLGLTEPTVSAHLGKAKRKIRDLLKENGINSIDTFMRSTILMDDTQQSSNTPIVIGQIWKHRIACYVVSIMDITEQVVYYQRIIPLTSSVHARICNRDIEGFMTRFVLTEHTVEDLKASVQQKLCLRDIKRSAGKTAFIVPVDLYSSAFVSLVDALVRCGPIEDNTIVSNLLMEFRSFDIVMAMLMDIAHNESRTDLHNQETRTSLLKKYTDDYKKMWETKQVQVHIEIIQ